MIRKLVETPQVAQYDLERDVLADRDHLEVHQRTDRLLGVGHRRAQLRAFLAGQALPHLVDDVRRQVVRNGCDLVGLEALDRIDEFLAVHRGDQRLADRVIHLDQDLAVTVGLDAIPDDQTIVDRQRFEDVGDVGGVQPVEDRAQLVQALADAELLDQRLLLLRGRLLAMHQRLDAPLLLGVRAGRARRTLRGLGVAHRSIALRGAVQQFLFGHGHSLALRAFPA